MSTSVYAEAVVGRENELRVVDAFLERASGGSAALIVEGEAGIGKTTLWKYGVDAARARGISVLACRPGAGETELSFACLDDLLSEVADETLPELPPPQ